jgi:hypothetical protein
MKFATIAVNPVTASIAVLEFKRQDGAILKLDNSHRLIFSDPTGIEQGLGFVSEVGDFQDALENFLAERVTTNSVAVAHQDVLAGYVNDDAAGGPDPGLTEQEILADADDTAPGYSGAYPA